MLAVAETDKRLAAAGGRAGAGGKAGGGRGGLSSDVAYAPTLLQVPSMACWLVITSLLLTDFCCPLVSYNIYKYRTQS